VLLHEVEADGVDHVDGEVAHEAHDRDVGERQPQRAVHVRLPAAHCQEVLLPEQEHCEEPLQEDLVRDVEQLAVLPTSPHQYSGKRQQQKVPTRLRVLPSSPSTGAIWGLGGFSGV
jgi:hypothetical protein